MTTIEQRYTQVTRKIAEYAQKHHQNPDNIQLLAVSKTRPATDIEALFQYGQKAFGENYLQEAEQKILALQHLAIEWHFIGGIQSNKTRIIAQLFDWVHSVASMKHARRLNDQRSPDKPALNICIQINTSGESSKDGIHPSEAVSFAKEIMQFERLNLRGLMTLPASHSDFEQQRQPFQLLNTVKKEINSAGMHLDTLSMGMSGDLEAAIAEAATIVRIGTALFGERIKKNPETIK